MEVKQEEDYAVEYKDTQITTEALETTDVEEDLSEASEETDE